MRSGRVSRPWKRIKKGHPYDPLPSTPYSLLPTPYSLPLLPALTHPIVKLLALALLAWGMSVTPVKAEFCRQVDGHRICIVNIKRSAKNYWQYQAVVSIDGIERSTASYDCRERSITDPDGNMSFFRSHPEGGIVCSLYRRRG